MMIGRAKPGSRRAMRLAAERAELATLETVIGDRPYRPDAMSMVCGKCDADTLLVSVDLSREPDPDFPPPITMFCTSCGTVERI